MLVIKLAKKFMRAICVVSGVLLQIAGLFMAALVVDTFDMGSITDEQLLHLAGSLTVLLVGNYLWVFGGKESILP